MGSLFLQLLPPSSWKILRQGPYGRQPTNMAIGSGMLTFLSGPMGLQQLDGFLVI